MSPRDISRHMLHKTPYNLCGADVSETLKEREAHTLFLLSSNAQSHDATIGLIRDVLDRGVNVTQVRPSMCSRGFRLSS
jgi:hypothetical protein